MEPAAFPVLASAMVRARSRPNGSGRREPEQSQQGETSRQTPLRLRSTGGQQNEAAVSAIFPEPTVIDGMPNGCLEFFRCSPRLYKSTE